MPEQSDRGLEVSKGRVRESPMARALALGDDAAGGFAVPHQLDMGKPVDLGYHDPVTSQEPYGFTGQTGHRDDAA